MEKQDRSTFTGTLGFVLAAAGSAVGLGNIWRFPYLAAKDGGGLFLVIYLVLALTFGFTLLITEVAIGRKTKQSPLTAYGKIKKKWRGLGIIACLVPVLILPYYCVIGGWVVQYFGLYLTNPQFREGTDVYFSNFISSSVNPILTMLLFLLVTAYLVYRGVDKGIEKTSRILMPLLFIFILIIAGYSLFLSYTDDSGVTRTGLQGFLIYLIPNFQGITVGRFFEILVDAMGQLFFSLSVAMGIMITYGSYMKEDSNLNKSINQIEIFDTLIAFLAGVMIIPAVYVFSGYEGLESSGPGLIFIALPQIFVHMGFFGSVLGFLFFATVLFAALTSSISIMEAIVSSFMDEFHLNRNRAVITVTVITIIMATIVCMGYNILNFELTLPNGTTGQILDLMDYISNSVLMPLVAILTCILIGWLAKPDYVISEVEKDSVVMGRKTLYKIMIKYVAPVLLIILFLKAFGLFG